LAAVFGDELSLRKDIIHADTTSADFLRQSIRAIRAANAGDTPFHLLQSIAGGLVGMGVSGVEVALACTEGVSVAVGASVAVAVAVATSVSAKVGVTVSTGACAPQAEVVSTRKRKMTSNFLLMETSFLLLNGEGRQFHYIQKMTEKPFFNKPNPG